MQRFKAPYETYYKQVRFSNLETKNKNASLRQGAHTFSKSHAYKHMKISLNILCKTAPSLRPDHAFYKTVNGTHLFENTKFICEQSQNYFINL